MESGVRSMMKASELYTYLRLLPMGDLPSTLAIVDMNMTPAKRTSPCRIACISISCQGISTWAAALCCCYILNTLLHTTLISIHSRKGVNKRLCLQNTDL